MHVQNIYLRSIKTKVEWIVALESEQDIEQLIEIVKFGSKFEFQLNIRDIPRPVINGSKTNLMESELIYSNNYDAKEVEKSQIKDNKADPTEEFFLDKFDFKTFKKAEKKQKVEQKRKQEAFELLNNKTYKED